MPDTYAYALGGTALIIFVAHWFPWPRRLHRLIAYAIGVTSILSGLAIWLIPSPFPCVLTGEGPGMGAGATGFIIWLMIMGIAFAAGLATALAWFVDWVLHLAAKDSIYERTTEPD